METYDLIIIDTGAGGGTLAYALAGSGLRILLIERGNNTALMAVDPRRKNPTTFQKSMAVNDFYFRGPGFAYPMGNIQLLGKLQAGMLTATNSHQCGTIRFGADPQTSVLYPTCRAHEVDNLYVVESSFLPLSAAMNPALIIAAQALRVAEHLQNTL